MNKHYRKVLDALKTNKDIKALGFSRKELKGIAANVADKLKLEEDASEEEVSDAINDAIDDVLPLLKFTQSAADRQVQEYKTSLSQSQPQDGEGEDDDDDDEPSRKSPSKPKGKTGMSDDDSAIAKLTAMFAERFDKLDKRMDTFESDRTSNNRRKRVEDLLKDTGKFGERRLRAFSRMNFKSDEDFEDYLDELQGDIEEENQDRANKGLETLGAPPATSHKKNEEEEMSDDEIKALAQG